MEQENDNLHVLENEKNETDKENLEKIQNNKNNKNEPDLSKYKDLEGLSIKKINTGFWFVRHRLHFRAIFILILSLFSMVTVTYSLYHYIYYAVFGIEEDRQLRQAIIDTEVNIAEYRANNTPVVLKQSSTGKISVGQSKYDLFAKLENSHEQFYGIFKYCFLNGEEELFCENSFILPKTSKYVLALSQEINNGAGISLEIRNFSWLRIDNHKYLDWDQEVQNRLNLPVEDIDFQSSKTSGLSEKTDLNKLEFKIINSTAYGYYELPINIFLYSGTKIIGVSRYVVYDFKSGNEKNITVIIPGSYSKVTDIEVVPDVNILKESNYIRYSGEGD